MPRKLLSSRLTFLYKFVFPVIVVVWVIWFGALFLYSESSGLQDFPIQFLAIGFVVAAINIVWMGWLALKSNRVEVDGENFYVSNFGKKIIIPRADLFEATEMRWVKPYWITLHLRRPSEFGDKVIFIPPWRMGAFWTANPLVDELNAMRTRW